MLLLLMLTLEVWSLSIHFWLFEVFRPHAGEIWTKSCAPNYKQFWILWQKMVLYFWQSIEAILKTLLWLKQLCTFLNSYISDFLTLICVLFVASVNTICLMKYFILLKQIMFTNIYHIDIFVHLSHFVMKIVLI